MPKTVEPEDLSLYTAADADALAERYSTPEAPVHGHDVRGAMRLAGLREATAKQLAAALERWRTEPV